MNNLFSIVNSSSAGNTGCQLIRAGFSSTELISLQFTERFVKVKFTGCNKLQTGCRFMARTSNAV
jgi:hypothetical protein